MLTSYGIAKGPEHLCVTLRMPPEHRTMQNTPSAEFNQIDDESELYNLLKSKYNIPKDLYILTIPPYKIPQEELEDFLVHCLQFTPSYSYTREFDIPLQFGKVTLNGIMTLLIKLLGKKIRTPNTLSKEERLNKIFTEGNRVIFIFNPYVIFKEYDILEYKTEEGVLRIIVQLDH